MHTERIMHEPFIAWNLDFRCMISQRSLPQNNAPDVLGLILNKL